MVMVVMVVSTQETVPCMILFTKSPILITNQCNTCLTLGISLENCRSQGFAPKGNKVVDGRRRGCVSVPLKVRQAKKHLICLFMRFPVVRYSS